MIFLVLAISPATLARLSIKQFNEGGILLAKTISHHYNHLIKMQLVNQGDF
jgi:hypothetical protein